MPGRHATTGAGGTGGPGAPSAGCCRGPLFGTAKSTRILLSPIVSPDSLMASSTDSVAVNSMWQ